MNKQLKNILALIIILSFQVVIYVIFFHPFLIKWGASSEETTMLMPGDKYSQSISSTRSVNIRNNSKVVWGYLADLGADRRGYYSYDFLEKMYGCKMAKVIKEKERSIYPGRIIPFDSSGKNNEGFKVLEVEQGKSFVLENWGSFMVKKIDSNYTRLIVRTNESKAQNIYMKLKNSVFDAMHYVMERRMMLGIKDIAEGNNNYNPLNDIIWLLCIFISGLSGIIMVFIIQGVSKYLYASVFFIVWQYVFLVPDPLAVYGLLLIMVVCAEYTLSRYLLFKKNKVQLHFKN
jgi:hypothetical protein